MNEDLELLRAFRPQDGTVDANSAHAARARLIAHISDPTGAARDRALRWPGRIPALRLTRGVIATALAIGVIIVVGAVFLGLRGHTAPRHVPATRHHVKGPLTLRNLAPASAPRLAGHPYCNADLARPGAIPGLGGAHSAAIVVHLATINGVNESPFSLTARGLAPTGRADEYAVWIRQVTGLSSTAVPVPGSKPRLLGVIAPGVAKDGKVAVVGVLPSDVNGDYLIRITRQPHSSLTKPGRTALTGVGQL